MHIFERDQKFVIEQFRQGCFDYLDGVSEVMETEFFRYIGAKNILMELARTFPSPSKKEPDVPVWFYMASDISMRLHGVHSYNAYPYVVRCGGMLNAFGPELGRKVKHPQTGDVTLACNGFNEKNYYDRQTPCDKDFLRKFSKKTEAEALLEWYNRDVVRTFKKHKAFDPDGIFIGDGSYIFVPDNPNYENSTRLFFDEHGHPVSKEARDKMTRAQLQRCQWRRCYKMVSLLHTDRDRSFFFCMGLRVLPGNAGECPVLYDLVREVVAAVGGGVIKRLILDRGFIDGAEIGRCKKEHGIDVLIPLRVNMDLYQDALGLLKGGDIRFMPYEAEPTKPVTIPRPVEMPEELRRREKKRQKTLRERKKEEPPPSPDKVLVRSEVAGIRGFRWERCPLPLCLIVNRETFADGHEHLWMLLDTKPLVHRDDPAARRTEYALRTLIEEEHRQVKCFWDLANFTSPNFNLVVNQIAFVLLSYSLLQLYFLRKGRKELNRRTRSRARDYLLPQDSFIIIYYASKFAILSTLEYTELLLTLSEEARAKILKKTRRLRRGLSEELKFPRPP